MFWLKPALLVALLALLGGSSRAQTEECESFQLTNEWPGGSQGTIGFVLDHTVNGWVLTLEFDSAFDTFLTWSAEWSQLDSTTVSLTNEEWDAEFNAGDLFELEFQLTFSSSASRPLLVGAKMDEQNVCGDVGQQTTTLGPGETPGPPTEAPTQGPTDPPPPVGSGKYDYNEVLMKSLLFYEAQRSGPLPSDNRVEWRGDSALDDYIPGGYYDAGDHVKFGFPMASMTTQLAWGAITFQEGYEAANQIDYMVACLKWATDYFIAAHTSEFEFYGQIGDGGADHAYWGRPEEMTMSRPASKISSSNGGGTDLAGETAAALAAASIFYRNVGDTSAADEALSHARELFDFAEQYRQSYVVAMPEAAGFYNSWSGFEDELAWAAAWMAKATGEASYLTMARDFYDEFEIGTSLAATEFSWDNKYAGVRVLMYDLTGEAQYEADVSSFMDFVLFEAPYTPKGMVYIDSWGSCRHAGNMAHLLSQIGALGLRTSECETFAENQINYILGDGGRSFVVGFGTNPPTQPHHRSSSCPDLPASCDWPQYDSPSANPQTLFGALVGGPNQSDQYNDDRHDYESNEVATDYNAGFQGALAALAQRYQ